MSINVSLFGSKDNQPFFYEHLGGRKVEEEIRLALQDVADEYQEWEAAPGWVLITASQSVISNVLVELDLLGPLKEVQAMESIQFYFWLDF